MSFAGQHVPPQSASEALSTLLWQPYDCRSPLLHRSYTDGALLVGSPRQSPNGVRHARASHHTILPAMRLPVPAPAIKADSVSVRVSGESRESNVSSVNIVQVSDVTLNVNSAVPIERERSVATAECQTDEPSRRRRTRRPRAPRIPELEAVAPPPPYSTLPPALHVVPTPAPILAHPTQPRFPFQPIPLRSGRGAVYACSEGEGNAPKSCCGRPPLRLCVLFLGVIGACLVAAGAILGSLPPRPRAPLTVLLLMIGIGVALVTAAGLAWRLGLRDSPCALLGLRRASCRRLVPRLPPSYARPHHPYAAMLYPEFHYRPPPPTYQASMQEYRLRMLLLDRSLPVASPPPTYRSNTASLVRGTTGPTWCSADYSGPPSYRAPRNESTVTVSETLPIQLDLKYVEDPLENIQDKDEHLVTIVQTDAQPVIVTVSGSPALNDNQIQHTTEIDILAHL